jgi:hypothetical protein
VRLREVRDPRVADRSSSLSPPSPQSPLSTLRTVTESAVTPTAVACTPYGDYTPSRPAEPGPCGLRTPNHKTTRHSRARPCPPPQAEPEDGVRNVGIWRTQQPAPRAAPAGAAFHDRRATPDPSPIQRPTSTLPYTTSTRVPRPPPHAGASTAPHKERGLSSRPSRCHPFI